MSFVPWCRRIAILTATGPRVQEQGRFTMGVTEITMCLRGPGVFGLRASALGLSAWGEQSHSDQTILN